MATRRTRKARSTNSTVEQLRQQIRTIVPEPLEPTPAERAEADDEQAPQPGQRKPPRGGWGNAPDLYEEDKITDLHFETAGEESQC